MKKIIISPVVLSFIFIVVVGCRNTLSSKQPTQPTPDVATSPPPTIPPMTNVGPSLKSVNDGKLSFPWQQGSPEVDWEQLKPLRGKVSQNEQPVFGAMYGVPAPPHSLPPPQYYSSEEYEGQQEGGFLQALSTPLSTFSIDVDTASYSNTRRFIEGSQLPPPPDAVRVEEFINYFTYDYADPTDEHPFSIITELSNCPWNEEHQLIHIGLQGKHIAPESIPDSNLVFLLDVSGSMRERSKLPLLKQAFRLLVEQLGENDTVSIVVYAGAAGTVLQPTPGNEKVSIVRAIDKLHAGGSTAGGQGIQLAYDLAKENFIKEGNNRVILATDGDFNVGISSNEALVELIEGKRDEGIFLTVLGFGTGNFKDAKMEQLADKGNGNYAYIDNIREAKKVLVSEMTGTLITIAKDVKIQVEFNPAKVKAYRLIGYENRRLADEDFVDDTKDAGELGSGHTVTALYEIIPFGSDEELPTDIELKYQETNVTLSDNFTNELMNVKLRYKLPDEEQSRPIVHPVIVDLVPATETSENFRFSSAVAEFGMLLCNSKYSGEANYDHALQLARGAKGQDEFGYRAEFIQMVETIGLQQLTLVKPN